MSGPVLVPVPLSAGFVRMLREAFAVVNEMEREPWASAIEEKKRCQEENPKT